MAKPDGGPAFPALDVEHFPAGYGHAERDEVSGRLGMSLRDYFAGQALAGLLGSTHPDHSAPTWEAYSACAYGHADAMLAERAK